MKDIRKIMYMSALLAFALVSCTEKLKEQAVPGNLNTNTTIVTASVEPVYFEGVVDAEFQYLWKEGDAIGLYGTNAGQNVKYSVVSSSLVGEDAQEGVARFYGGVVSGDLSAYFPYSKSGHEVVLEDRIPIPAVQHYCARPYEHVAANGVFVAVADEDKHFNFFLSAALLKVVVPVELTGITSAKITVQNASEQNDAYVAGNLALGDGVTPKFTEPSTSVTITNIGGLNSTIEQPFEFYVLVANGRYENFIVTLSGDGWVINKPLNTQSVIAVERGQMVECTVLDVEYNYGMGDFGSEDGSFTQQ